MMQQRLGIVFKCLNFATLTIRNGSQENIFSYSSQDASAFALKLYNDLRDAGAEVWIDQSDIKAGARLGC